MKYFICILLIIAISCKKENKSSSIKDTKKDHILNKEILNQSVEDKIEISYRLDENVFLGDSTLSMKKYFDNLTNNNGYSKLKKQNDLYINNYSNFNNDNIAQISSDGNIKLKFEKQFIKSEKKI